MNIMSSMADVVDFRILYRRLARRSAEKDRGNRIALMALSENSTRPGFRMDSKA